MDFWQAIFLGFLQGATELFPVSSLGHAVIIPRLLGWRYDQHDPAFLPYVVLLHLGTATALIVVFRADWLRLSRAFVRAVYRGRLGPDPDEKLSLLLLVGTVPAAVAGGFFEKEVRGLFTSARLACIFLLLNAGIMMAGELLRRRQASRRNEPGPDPDEVIATAAGRIGFRTAFLVGASQALALLPGISRSGTTMTAGLLAGLNHEAAARYSFLLATPIILAAGLVETPQLSSAGARLPQYVAGALVAAVTAYLTTRFLLRYFRSGRLDPFAAYCAVLGTVGLLLIH